MRHCALCSILTENPQYCDECAAKIADGYIERAVKNVCGGCSYSFRNSVEHWKRHGNWCSDCISRINRFPLPGSHAKSTT